MNKFVIQHLFEKRNLAVILIFLPALLFSQSPGGVGTANLTAWFRADGLPNGNLTTWTSTFPAISVTDAAAPYPQITNTPPNASSNYNSTVSFLGNSPANVLGLQNPAITGLLTNSAASNSQGSFFCSYYLPAFTQDNGHMVLYNAAPHGIQFRVLNPANPIGRLAIGNTGGNSVNASRDWVEDLFPSIISYKGNRLNANSMQAYQKDWLFTNALASQSSGNAGLYMGFGVGASSHYNGYINEIIFFDRDLTAIEMNRVHSYLAIKFGITLLNTGGGIQGDYNSSNGTLVWDASDNPTYHNHVIGIARDDNTALLQKQSHSFSDDYRIYLSNLAPTNVENTGSFSNDNAHLMMGHINGNLCASLASNAEAPGGISARIAREWKVTKTNFNETFSWDVRIDTCNTFGYVAGPLDLNNLRLLVDTDGNFTNATILSAADGLTFSYSNGYITVYGISNTHIPNNTTRYITIAYADVTVSLSGPAGICAGGTATITVNISGTNNPIDVTYTADGNSFTLNNITDGYTFDVQPTSTTTYSISGMNNFLSCCGSSAGASTYTLTVNPIPNVVANANPVQLCLGDSTLLFGSGASTYVWGNGIANNSYVSPTETSTYTVTGASAAGCTNTASVTVNVLNNTAAVFQPIGPFCAGSAIPALPTTSENGIVGTWSPTINNLQTTSYTFTPSTLQCVTNTSLTIQIENASILSITNDDPLCDPDALSWVTWDNIIGNLATGSIGDDINIEVSHSAGGFFSTAGIYNGALFPPEFGLPIASTSLASQNAGVFTFCFDTPVTNPQIALSSIGNPGTPVQINTSVPYYILWAGQGVTYLNNQSLVGTEGYTIIVFPGTHTCISFDYLSSEFYCNVTFGIQDLNCQIGPICEGESINLVAHGSSNVVWSPSDGLSSTTGTQVTATPSNTITYTITEDNICQSEASVTITVIPNTISEFDTFGPFCAGNPVPALPTTSNNGIQGIWTPATINNQTTGNYTFDPLPGQCSDPVEITVTINPVITPTFNPIGPFCSGESIPALPTTSNDGVVGTWSPEINNNSTTNYVFTPNAGVCTNTANLTLVIIPTPNANFDANPITGVQPLLVTFNNLSSVASNYTWNFGDGTILSTSNTNTVENTYFQSGTFSATLIAENQGCTDTALQIIVVIPDSSFVNVPNVFSPNGDGANDFFDIEKYNIVEFDILIMNRWGNVVYTSNSLSNSWNGTSNGSNCSEGVYFYKIVAKGADSTVHELHGFLHLIRD